MTESDQMNGGLAPAPERRWGDWLALLALLVLAALLALPAGTPMADSSVFSTLDMLAHHNVPSWHPFRYPAPDDSWGTRPISVWLLKQYLILFGPEAPPDSNLLILKAFVTTLWFGLGSRAWLRAYGFKRVAPMAMLGTVVMSPSLYSAWQLTQFDTVGAGALLFACALMTKPKLVAWDKLLVTMLLILSLFLKESSGIITFGFLGAAVFVHWRRGEREMAKRHMIPIVLGILAWVIVAWKMLEAKGPPGRALMFMARLPIVEHMALQLVYLVSAAGSLLVVCLLWRHSGRPEAGSRWIWLGPSLTVACLLVAPLLDYHSHYEAAFYVTRWASLVALLLIVALVHRTFARDGELGLTMAAAGILGSVGSMSAVYLIGLTTREDLASRIFIPALPLLMGLAGRAVVDGWATARTLSGRPAQAMRWTHTLGFAALVWYAAAHPLNLSQEWQARGPVDTDGRRELATKPLSQATVLFNNTSQWLGAGDLIAIGGEKLTIQTTQFTPCPVWFNGEVLPTVKSGDGLHHPERVRQMELPIYLYLMANRSEMDPAVNATLEGDLSWTRSQVGLLTPLDFFSEQVTDDNVLRVLFGGVPSSDKDRTKGPNPWGEPWPDTRPAHNWMEDIRRTTYRAGPSPLEITLKDDTQQIWSKREPYIRVPLDLLSVPRRLLTGAPLVENYAWEVVLYGPAAKTRQDG